MATQVINEKSTSYLVANFLDKNSAPALPSSVTYRLDCLTTGTQILADTALTPATSIEIEITGTQNAIISSTNEYERKLITVKATYAGSQTHNSEYVYTVKNMVKVT